MGWNVGLNAGGGLANGLVGWTTAFAGALVTMTGMLIPSTTLTYVATRWGHRNRELRAVRAFKQGLAPIVVGLLIATGWVLVRGDADSAVDPELVAVALVSMLVVWRTQVHILWLLGTGALLGAMGLV
jgi:chromate transporter